MASHHGVEHRGELVPIGTVFSPGRFGRMFPQLPPLIVDVTALDQLAGAMVDNAPALEISVTPQPGDNGNITAGYTYLGQFVDHDITLDTTSLSERPIDPQAVFNFRTPKLELDSLYAIGPGGQPFMYDRSQPAKFIIGRTVSGRGDPTIPAGMPNDLPRSEQGFALIGDLRNDENLLVAQLHLAFLKFHNKVVDGLIAQGVGGDELFERARQTVRWHYQWIVLHDFLDRLAQPGIAAKILHDGRKFYRFKKTPYMPVEFSAAAYRFGHSMVRGAYDYNRVFTFGTIPATLQLLFQFTGNGSPAPFLGQAEVLPFSWIIEWNRFVDKGSSTPDHFARKIDTQLAPPLRDMVNEGNDPALPVSVRDILKRLARRNLLRGYLLSIPTGQAVAEAIGVTPLSADELRPADRPAIAQALEAGDFLERTPLWYYVLREAEVRANGNSLGELGSRIICDTIIGLVINDPRSYLNQTGGWDPSKGVRLPNGDPIVTIADMLRFAGVFPEPGQS
jgi:hypothetical protein